MSTGPARFGSPSVGGRSRAPLPVLILALLAGAMLLSGLPRADKAQAKDAVRYEGVATCAGSTCHGRSEGSGAVVRQDEIATWQDPSAPSGAHSRAYAALSSKRGLQIAHSLGWKDATSHAECLGCHSTYVPVSERGRRFRLDDGVGCESCHGPASGWIAIHYTTKGSHANNVAHGLVPLEKPQVRARVCLDCHYGSKATSQFVTHSMMAAGHPRISFELDLFSTLQQHYNIDADYIRRKGRPNSVQIWAVGQAEAVRRETDLFSRERLARNGLFPQFTFFDCHSCHRQIHDGPKRHLTFEPNPGRPIIFGNPPFNDENMIMLDAVATVLVPGQAQAYHDAARAFHASMNTGYAATQKAAIVLRDKAAALSNALAGRAYNKDDAFVIIARIGARATSDRFTDYAGSAQAVMAIDTLLNALVKEDRVTVGAAAGIRANINRAYAAVASPNTYHPAAFRAALGDAVTAIGRLR